MDVFLNFLISSDPRCLAVVRAAVGELGSLFGLKDEESRGVTLAVDEALANVIRHAYHGNHERTIRISCQGLADRLEFILLDQGEPPDPGRLEAHALDDVALGGRGTHIIRSVMDEVCYERVPGGNQLRLSKRLVGLASRGEEEMYEHRDSR